VSIDQEEAETNTIATEGNTETDTFIIDTETDTCTVVGMDIEPSTEIEIMRTAFFFMLPRNTALDIL
jgi:hypothetical protein